MTHEEQAKKAQEMIRAVYEDGKAEINGREYVFLKMQHKQRRKVFAFATRVQGQINTGNLGFVDSPDFEPVEDVIYNAVTFDGSLLSKLGDEHWDAHPGDYIQFIAVAMGVISYPFMGANATD